MNLFLQNIDKIVHQEIYLKDVNLEFELGTHNVLLGRTLSGKTTLLRIMAGLDRPTRGKNSHRRSRCHGRFCEKPQRGDGLSAVYQLPLADGV